MINRTYIVKMPATPSTGAVDIPVQSAPGSSAVPVTTAVDAVYYEWRGRTLRFEQLKLLSTGAANPSWSPRVRLGIQVSVVPWGNAAIVTDVPDVQLSASFGTFGVTGIAIPALADSVSNGPILRLIGGAGTSGKFFAVNLSIAEAKDEDLSPTGRG